MKFKTVLSLFDGISAAQLALVRAGIAYEKYYASEIEKNAMAVTMKRFPETVQLGNIKELTAFRLNVLGLIGNVDLLIGGSPCTSLSSAAGQKESGLDKGASVLFWEYVRVLNIVKPKFFVLENVASMKKTDKDAITKILGIEPILIDSALVSAQSRKRLYWTNIQGITQPDDKKIYLRDVIIDGFADRDKSYCVVASIGRGNIDDYLNHRGRQMIFTDPEHTHYDKPVRVGTIGKANRGEVIYDIGGKSITITACKGGGRASTGLYMVPEAQTAADKPARIGTFGKGRQGEKIYSADGKSITLHSGIGGSSTGLYITGPTESMDLGSKYLRKYARRLYPVECERLQTIPDDYTAGFSNTARYKMIGNSFTVDVIAHILSFAKITGKPAGAVIKQKFRQIPLPGEVGCSY